jgi:hypothetical protein
MPKSTLMSALAKSFLGGEPEVGEIVARASQTLGRRWPWLRPLAQRYSEAESAGELADWLWLDQGELEWFADLKGLGYKKREPKLRHYSYRVLAKSCGG